VKSQSGERGMFNRRAALAQMTASGRRKPWPVIGTNPCGEIILRDKEFCNLTEVVVRPSDTISTLREKVKTATMLGCWQATYVNFPMLRQTWHENCAEERLLGVSLTGMMDHPVLNHVNDKAKKWLAEMKHVAIQEARRWSKILGINMPTAITCVKPSGTVSLVVDSASGIHPRYSQYYIRRVRISATDPLFKMLRDQGVPAYPEVGQTPETADTWVLEFPTASPMGAKTRHDYSALMQLEHWLMVKEFWCEHNPSITVYVREDEWLDVGAWLYKNFDSVSGVSFLPKDDDHVYELAPIEEISQARYEQLISEFPRIDYSKLSEYEVEDATTGSREFACTAGGCEI
jgi:ribonucleoside-triphosphate reductase (thioredoxin)